MTKDEEIQKLQDEIARLREEVESLRSGVSGYLVATPNSTFSGQTAGVYFRKGKAFIPMSDHAMSLARQMEQEFGYQVEFIDDFRGSPETEPLRKSFIDVLVQPQQV